MIWLTRGSNSKINRDTGQVAIGSYNSRVPGPDGVSDSAINFDGESSLQLPINRNVNGDVTFQFNFKLGLAATIPVIAPDAAYTGNDLDGAERIGCTTEYIKINRTLARFEFYCNNTASAYLSSEGWTNSVPADPVSPATEMGIWFDIDRSCWLFIVDGLLVGVVNGNL
jgi:hypothetical protein